jgi:hypothetical protein
MAERRISLFPARLILKGIITFIQGANERKETVILYRAISNFPTVFVIVITDAGFVVAAVGDHENQRLSPPFGTGAHHFDGNVAFMLVDFVNQCAVRAWTRLTIVGTDRAKERASL